VNLYRTLNDPVRQTVEFSSSHARTKGNYSAELISIDSKVISSILIVRIADFATWMGKSIAFSAPLRLCVERQWEAIGENLVQRTQ